MSKRYDNYTWLQLIAIIVLTIGIVGGVWLLSAWLIMIAWNAVAAWFGFKTISFGVAMAVMLLLTIIQGLFRGSK